jgi:hypothetical protein
LKPSSRARLVPCCTWLLASVAAAMLWGFLERSNPDLSAPPDDDIPSCFAETRLSGVVGVRGRARPSVRRRRTNLRRNAAVELFAKCEPALLVPQVAGHLPRADAVRKRASAERLHVRLLT